MIRIILLGVALAIGSSVLAFHNRSPATCAVLDAHGNAAMSLRDWTQVQKQRETD